MRILAWCGVLLCALTAACTVDRTPAAGPSGAPSTGGATARPCPWSEQNGQEYEPETGRIRLVVTCLPEPHATAERTGWVYSGPTPDQGGRVHRYADGMTVAVLCVEPAGSRFADSAEHASTVWFQVQGSFANGENDGTGWVPHAATGYARTAGQDPCPPR
jgi:hypothetical protein